MEGRGGREQDGGYKEGDEHRLKQRENVKLREKARMEMEMGGNRGDSVYSNYPKHSHWSKAH